MASAALGTAFRHLRDLFAAGSVLGLEDGPLLARYSRSNDPAAFEALVSRHGPMVLATCRAVLRNEHDVEDAFQATFLVLAKKARSIRESETLGGWLHRVAYRASVQASVQARKRKRNEAEAAAMAPPDASRPATEIDVDLRPVLHEEIERLPESHRLAVVLCDLQGLTYEQAAEQLRWTVPTLRCRLAKARQVLKGRLTRRGLAPPAVGPMLIPKPVLPSIPPALLRATVLAATGGGSASVGVTLLTHLLLRGMLMTKIKIASTAALAALALATGGVIAAGSGPIEVSKPEKEPTSMTRPEEPRPAQGGEVIRVLDPDGKPAVGAKVYRSNNLFRGLDHDMETAVLFADTGPDGTFRLTEEDAKAAKAVKDDEARHQILAMTEGRGPALAVPSAPDGLKVLRLVRDDVPIRGRVLDVDGKPVVGASVQLMAILWHSSNQLDEWLAALEAEKVAYPVQYRLLHWWASNDLPSLFPAVITDRDGRFTLRGVGRERVASMLISGPGIETRFEYAATREMPEAKYPDFDRQNVGSTVTYHGASFDMVAGPGLEIVGTVVDQDTGQPIAGVTVRNTAAFGNPLRFLKTTTDAQGRYKLQGLPPKSSFGDDQELLASLKDGPPYLAAVQEVGEGRGTITRDFRLKRGAWATGRVIDRATGKAVRAQFDYFILEDNPHLKDYPKYGTVRVGMPFYTDDDGRYKIAVMPGRGILGARKGNDSYRLGVGVDKIPGLKIERGMVRAEPSYLMPTNYNTVVGIDPKPGDESVVTDIELDRGRTLQGTIVGPGGESVPGARIMGEGDHFQSWSRKPLPSATFEVHGLGSDRKRGLLFWHKEKNLAASYVVKPGEIGPLTIKLEPAGSLNGRLVDDDGRPRAGVQMTCNRPYEGEDSRFASGSLPDPIQTDADGRFHASGLVPGLKYSLSSWKGRMMTGDAIKDVVVKPGEVKDLGDVKLPEPKQ